MLKLTTTEIEIRLAHYFNYRQNLIVPNISWGMNIHECDLLIIRKSGYGIEVEIKVSKADLIKDIKKSHHHHDKLGRISEFYFAIPDYLQNCIEFIPDHAGIIIVNKTEYGTSCRKFRDPKPNLTRRKFTDQEISKIGHLGSMRIWNLKRALIDKKK